MNSIDYLTKQILDAYHLDPKKQYSKGQSGALVLLCDSVDKGLVVLKVAVNERSQQELEANKSGYIQLRQEGLERVLPDTLITSSLQGRGFIIMSYLGDDFLDRVKQSADPLKDYEKLCTLMNEIYTQTRRISDHSNSSLSLVQTLLLNAYKQRLLPSKLITESAVKQAASVDITGLAPTYSTFACFDFTPEDIFIQGGTFKYPDPKHQIRGLPLIDLACFSGVSLDSYHLPGSEQGYRVIENFALQEVSRLLELDEASAQKIFNYGRAFQLAMSAKVRINSEPEKAQSFASQSLDYLNRVSGS